MEKEKVKDNVDQIGISLFKYYLILAVFLWIVVAVVIVINRRKGKLS